MYIYRYISFEIKTFHSSINTVMIQIESIQTFRTVQVENVNKKQKDTNFSLYLLLQKCWFSPILTVQWRRQECH